MHVVPLTYNLCFTVCFFLLISYNPSCFSFKAQLRCFDWPRGRSFVADRTERSHLAVLSPMIFENCLVWELLECQDHPSRDVCHLVGAHPLPLYSGSDRFKWLDLIECLMNCGLRFETLYRIKTIPKKKKCRKAKWLSENVLQIAVKRREVKSKGEKEWYTHLNSEFRRIASRDKKAFLCDLCKEIEENNRMGKTKHLFKKYQGNISRKDGFNKGQRWQEYTEQLCKKIFTTELITMVWSLT